MKSRLLERESKISSIAIIALAALCLLPFLRLAFYAHSYLDDFCFPAAVHQQGIWSFTISTYFTWSGRFAACFITALHPLAWGGLKDVKPFVFGFILAFTSSVLFACNALLSGCRVPLHTRVAAGSIVLALLLLMLPSPTEAFYWLTSGLCYMGGVISCYLLFGTIAALQVERRPALRRAWWGLAALLAFMAPGFSEMICCFVLALFLVLLPQIWCRQLTRGSLILLGLAVLGSALSTLAPGNFIRQGSHSFPLIESITGSSIALAYSLISWLGNGFIIVITLLLLPIMQRLVRLPGLPLIKLTQRPWLWPIGIITGLLLCYVLTYLVRGSPPPSRARNMLFCFFIIGWFMSIVGLLAYRLRIGLEVLPHLPIYGRVVLISLMLLLITSDHNFKLKRDQVGTPTNSVAQAYRDWFSGDASKYDREEEARYKLIQCTKDEFVEIPKLSVQPVTLVWWDISTNSTLWGNRAYAAFFKKKGIVVKP